jgi:hypothetical protein
MITHSVDLPKAGLIPNMLHSKAIFVVLAGLEPATM